MQSSKPTRSSRLRPQRFALDLPVWYRAGGETTWHTGVTTTISSTGAVIRSNEPIAPTGQVLIAISLSDSGGCLVGHGRIARATVPSPDGQLSTFAVDLEFFRLDRHERVFNDVVTH